MLNDFFETLAMHEVATGFQFTEGPVWHPEGYLLFSDIPASIIYQLWPGQPARPWRTPSGHSNGLTFDRQGRLIACEHGNRRVSRTEADGRIIALADRYQGRRLNSPNDVVVRSDGIIYFTDPPYGIQPGERELDWNGVYRILPDGTLELLVDDFDRPNGLAFSPDESVLYIDDSPRRHIRAFDVAPDGTLRNGRLFADMASDQPGSPDGMKVDIEGNIYCTGPGGLWVFRPSGECVGVIAGPQLPANVAFGGPDRRTLYITARTSVYTLRTKIPGLPVF
ncbi:MAG: SMP-30/gluconolactonase/LRE family protein [Chloroflexi bacterium]|nr:SMP-30/gluconolactonase/LRE family protein [Chloroflexota bacterium]